MTEDLKESRLDFLHAAVQGGSIRAAAERLDVAPSAVSRQIALLEEELALPLIERHARGIRPTEAGHQVLAYHREQRAHRSDLLSHLDELRGLRQGRIHLALGEGFVEDLMSGPVCRFNQAHPDISLVVDIGGTDEVVRRVSEDEAEIGLVMNPPHDPRITSVKSSRQAVQAIVGPDFPLLGQAGPFSIQDFLHYPIALNHPTYGLRQIMQYVEQSERIRLTPHLTTNSFFILRQFVRFRLGVAFLPAFVVAHEIAHGEIHSLPVAHPIMANAEAHLIKRSGRKLSFAAQAMLQAMAGQLQCLR